MGTLWRLGRLALAVIPLAGLGGCGGATDPDANLPDKPLVLIYPRGGQSFRVGDTVLIRWRAKADGPQAVNVRVGVDTLDPVTLNQTGSINPVDSTSIHWIIGSEGLQGLPSAKVYVSVSDYTDPVNYRDIGGYFTVSARAAGK